VLQLCFCVVPCVAMRCRVFCYFCWPPATSCTMRDKTLPQHGPQICFMYSTLPHGPQICLYVFNVAVAVLAPQNVTKRCLIVQNVAGPARGPQHSTTCCNSLRLTATRCNSLQLAATHCNLLQLTATHQCEKEDCETAAHYNSLQLAASHCILLQLDANHCNTLQHTATHQCEKEGCEIAAHCNSLQLAATRCSSLQHTATYCHTTVREKGLSNCSGDSFVLCAIAPRKRVSYWRGHRLHDRGLARG